MKAGEFRWRSEERKTGPEAGKLSDGAAEVGSKAENGRLLAIWTLLASPLGSERDISRGSNVGTETPVTQLLPRRPRRDEVTLWGEEEPGTRSLSRPPSGVFVSFVSDSLR